MKNKTIIYEERASNSKRDSEHDFYCCLLPQCEALCTCRSGFPIATIPSGFSLIGYIKRSYYPVEIHGLVAMMLLTIWVALSSMKE